MSESIGAGDAAAAHPLTGCRYIQSRFYRAPEVVLGRVWGSPIDAWSVGCLLAELTTGRPLFPARSEKDLLVRWIAMIGPPPAVALTAARFAEELLPCGARDGPPWARAARRRQLSQAVGLPPGHPLVDLIEQLLRWDPTARPTPAEGLKLV